MKQSTGRKQTEVDVKTEDTDPSGSGSEGAREDSGNLRRSAGEDLLLAAGVLFVLILAVLLKTDGTHVYLSLFGGTWTAPDTCILRNIFGVRCAGCGLTRSFISIANGEIVRSLHFNRTGIIFFLFLIFQLPYRLYAAWVRSRGRQVTFDWTWLAVKVAIGMLFLNWFLNLLFLGKIESLG